MFEYFYGQQSELFKFFKIPKAFTTDDRFRIMSAEAKLLYGLLFDRMCLSAQNDWIDDNGRVYIIFTIQEIQENMNCSAKKAVSILNELEHDVGLIERKRQGLGRPNLIYVKNFVEKAPDHFR